jgi:hypothetical protein
MNPSESYKNVRLALLLVKDAKGFSFEIIKASKYTEKLDNISQECYKKVIDPVIGRLFSTILYLEQKKKV